MDGCVDGRKLHLPEARLHLHEARLSADAASCCHEIPLCCCANGAAPATQLANCAQGHSKWDYLLPAADIQQDSMCPSQVRFPIFAWDHRIGNSAYVNWEVQSSWSWIEWQRTSGCALHHFDCEEILTSSNTRDAWSSFATSFVPACLHSNNMCLVASLLCDCALQARDTL